MDQKKKPLTKKKTTTGRSNLPPLLIGYGLDIHNTGNKDGLTLGGLYFPDEKGLVAHSDGDVMLHAVANAVLGALGRGDIGLYFSDKNAANKGIDSKLILKHALEEMRQTGFHIGNADVQIVAQELFIAPKRKALQDSLEALLHTSFVNVKGTRWEKKSRQVSCHVVLTLIKN